MNRGVKIILLILFVLSIDIAFGQGCSQCKMVAEQGSELDEGGFGSNINSGILYLMAAPYILLIIIFRKKIVTLFKELMKTP